MGDYPTGTTLHDHDAAFDAADENAIMRVIEDRADDEIAGRGSDPDRYETWLTDTDDPARLAHILAVMSAGDPDQAVDGMLMQLRKDYIDYRVECAKDTGEWDEIAAELARGDE